MRKVSAEEAVKVIKSGDRVFIHSIAAAPHALIDSMIARAPELEDVEIVQIHTEGEAKYATPEYANTFRTHAMFVGANLRKAVREGYADYIPVFLSEIPSLFRRKILPLNVALVQVSPPDKHGYCSSVSPSMFLPPLYKRQILLWRKLIRICHAPMVMVLFM